MAAPYSTFCLNCAFKHISIARTVLGEMLNGWNDAMHLSRAIGNLACAEEHLMDKPMLTRRVRGYRLRWVEQTFDGMGGLPDLDELSVVELYGAIDGLLRDIVLMKSEDGVLPPLGESDGETYQTQSGSAGERPGDGVP